MLTILSILFISGCASIAPKTAQYSAKYPGATEIVGKCSEAYQLISTAIHDAGVSDAEAQSIDGFPYLRSNRFLASFKDELHNEVLISAWLDHLIKLDQQARFVELRNLPTKDYALLAKTVSEQTDKYWTLEKVINECPQQLKAFDLNKPERIVKIKQGAMVADEYSLLKRTIGFYPISKYGAYYGYQNWKKENLATFNNITDWEGTQVAYQPVVSTSLSANDLAEIIQQSRNNPLAIPVFNQQQFKQMAEHFAPIFLLDESSDADKIGQPIWSEKNEVTIDHSRPVSVVRLEYTRFNDSILPQLVYSIWFTERPKESGLDILAGKLDGIIWRVTVDDNGKILIADTIHPCGCYHLFFPSKNLSKQTTKQNSLSEGITTPAVLPSHTETDRLTLGIESSSHYLQSLSNKNQAAHKQQIRSYDLIVADPIPDFALRSMPLADGGFKSIYQTNGLIKGTERAERWLLWPMGIKSPGAMRQWGRHATQFVGRRHFDDPYLFDDAFKRNSQ
ncbi:MAG: hypothetical protein ACPHLK_05225 [Gammaproteobacteria bacterium]